MEQMTISVTPATGGYVVTVYTKEDNVGHAKPCVFTNLADVHQFLIETVSEPAPEPAPASE